MMIYHTTLLLSIAWALLIFKEKQVCCGVVIVSSSSSNCGTFCNGMCCPSGSSCVVSENVINGNKTSDKSCSSNGKVVRQEIITESNGVMCIKNLTMMGEKVNVEQSCRNLTSSSSNCGTFCNGMCCPSGSSCVVSVYVINGNKTSDTSCFSNGKVVRQEIITESNGVMCIKNLTMMGEVNVEQSCRNLSKAEIDDMEQESKLHEEQWDELQRGIKKKIEDTDREVKMKVDALERANEARAERLKARMAELQRKLGAMFG